MKKNIIFGLIIVSFVLAGCKQEAKDAKEASTEVLKELSGGQETVTETPGQNMQSLKQRVIEDQTFEIQLDDWGMVTFTSVAPEDNSNKPEFLLMKNDKIMYEFPEITAAISDSFIWMGKRIFYCCSNIVMTEIHGICRLYFYRKIRTI